MIKAVMQRAVSASILLLLIACPKFKQPPESELECKKLKDYSVMRESQRAHVIKVADGDTFTACLLPGKIGSVRVRILGIDCPETSENAKCKNDEKQGRGPCKAQIPIGKKAGELAKRTLLNQNVFLESTHANGTFEKDSYGRVLAYVRTTSGEDFGKRMIEQGYCENYQWKYPHPRGVEYGAISPLAKKSERD